MQNIKISKAIPDDAEGIQTLTAEASKGMYALCGWSVEEIQKHFNPEKIKNGANRLKENITNFTEDDTFLVAKDEEGKIVGCCFAEKQEDKNTIEAVYVLPEYQGTGLAKRLYDKASESLNPQNDTFLDVFSLNSRGIGFYKKQGFIETGKKTFDDRFIGSDGKKLEITEMKKNK